MIDDSRVSYFKQQIARPSIRLQLQEPRKSHSQHPFFTECQQKPMSYIIQLIHKYQVSTSSACSSDIKGTVSRSLTPAVQVSFFFIYINKTPTLQL